MLAYLKRLYNEAKTKVTTYVALAIAAVARLAAHAQDILDSMPQVKALLPDAKIISSGLTKWVIPGLGVLAVWTRVRRVLGIPDTPPPQK